MRSIYLLVFVLCISPIKLTASPNILSVEQWQEDLDKLVEIISDNHFRPWSRITQKDFEAASADLRSRLGVLDDHQIMVELVSLTQKIEDGHTRLSLPREHANLAIQLETGHAGNEDVSDERLRFANLPVVFELFSDGVFIVDAEKSQSELLGCRVSEIDRHPVEEIIAATRKVNFAENETANLMWAADRLALPQVLNALGLTNDPKRVEIRATCNDADISKTIESLPVAEQIEWSAAFTPFRISPPGPIFYHEFLDEDRALYMRINELELTGPELYSDRLLRLLTEARTNGTEMILLDLRYNIGGSGSWNAAFVRAFLSHGYDRYGDLYLLIGRQTFSAAALLVLALEEYLEPIYVGENMGARPNHFGDSNRFQLPNSGLTLRVSSRFHASPWGNDDQRNTVPAHLEVPYTYQDYINSVSGIKADPAVRTALSFHAPSSLSGQLEWIFRRGLTQEAVFFYFRYLADPARNSIETYDDISQLGYEFLEDKYTEGALYIFALLAQFYPANSSGLTGLGFTYEAMGETGEALNAHKNAISIDPSNQESIDAVARLENN